MKHLPLPAALAIVAAAAILGVVAGRASSASVLPATTPSSSHPADRPYGPPVRQEPVEARLARAEAVNDALRNRIIEAKRALPRQRTREEKLEFARHFLATIDDKLPLRDHLLRLEQLDEEMALIFLEALKAETDPERRERLLCLALECGGPEACRYLNSVLSLGIRNPDWNVAVDALNDLSRGNQYRYPRLRADETLAATAEAMTTSDDPGVQWLGIVVLGWRDSETARRRLEVFIEGDSDDWIKGRAVMSLANLATPETRAWIEAWEERSADDEHIELMEYVERAKRMLRRGERRKR